MRTSDKRVMVEQGDEPDVTYLSKDGWKMHRPIQTEDAGEFYPHHWNLVNSDGQIVDHDQYRYDLESRHNLRLVSHEGD